MAEASTGRRSGGDAGEHPLAVLAARPEVVAAVAASRTACAELRWHPALRRRAAAVHAEVCVRGAAASAEAAGARLPLAAVRSEVLHGAGAGASGGVGAGAPGGAAGPAAPPEAAGADGRGVGVADTGDVSTPGSRASGVKAEQDPVLATVRGAVRATSALDELSPRLPTAPRQVLARLHTLAAVGLVADAELGRPRPPAAARIQALTALLSHPAAARLPALPLAAVCYGEIVTTGAFDPVSGVVARALARGVATQWGLDPLGVCLPERHVLADRAGHDTALAGYRDGGDGVLAWVQWWGEAMVAGARYGRAAADAVLAGRLTASDDGA